MIARSSAWSTVRRTQISKKRKKKKRQEIEKAQATLKKNIVPEEEIRSISIKHPPMSFIIQPKAKERYPHTTHIDMTMYNTHAHSERKKNT
jgi:hypothetical protein